MQGRFLRFEVFLRDPISEFCISSQSFNPQGLFPFATLSLLLSAYCPPPRAFFCFLLILRVSRRPQFMSHYPASPHCLAFCVAAFFFSPSACSSITTPLVPLVYLPPLYFFRFPTGLCLWPSTLSPLIFMAARTILPGTYSRWLRPVSFSCYATCLLLHWFFSLACTGHLSCLRHFGWFLTFHCTATHAPPIALCEVALCVITSLAKVPCRLGACKLHFLKDVSRIVEPNSLSLPQKLCYRWTFRIWPRAQ